MYIKINWLQFALLSSFLIFSFSISGQSQVKFCQNLDLTGKKFNKEYIDIAIKVPQDIPNRLVVENIKYLINPNDSIIKDGCTYMIWNDAARLANENAIIKICSTIEGNSHDLDAAKLKYSRGIPLDMKDDQLVTEITFEELGVLHQPIKKISNESKTDVETFEEVYSECIQTISKNLKIEKEYVYEDFFDINKTIVGITYSALKNSGFPVRIIGGEIIISKLQYFGPAKSNFNNWHWLEVKVDDLGWLYINPFITCLDLIEYKKTALTVTPIYFMPEVNLVKNGRWITNNQDIPLLLMRCTIINQIFMERHYSNRESILAIEEANKILETDSLNLNVLGKYFISRARMGDYEDEKVMLSWFDNKLQLTTEASDLYTMVNFYALKGDTEKALTYLEKSLQSGFKNIQHIETDEDLVSIQNLSRFKELLQKYKID